MFTNRMRFLQHFILDESGNLVQTYVNSYIVLAIGILLIVTFIAVVEIGLVNHIFDAIIRPLSATAH